MNELPYFNCKGNLADFHGRFNNLLQSNIRSKRYLDKLTSLYDLDLFKLNTLCNRDVNTVDNLYNQRIHSRYFSPHSFKGQNKYLIENDNDSFSVFHNNLISLSKNFESLQSSILDELGFNFNIIGITETKINDSNSESTKFSLPGYEFEFVPTPLAFGGVGMFIDETLHYTILEKTSNEAFPALWVELSFASKKNIICGIIHRQHNSPERFLDYFEQTLEKFISTGKNVCVTGDFNLCLLKSEVSEFSHNFLLSLQSCYLIPTIDKPSRVRGNSASLIDNIFVNNPECVSVSGNIISDVSDHFWQFCIFRSARDRIKPTKRKMRDFTNFDRDAFTQDLNQTDWQSIIADGNNDIDYIFSSFYSKYNKIINKHVPIKQISRRQLKRFQNHG